MYVYVVVLIDWLVGWSVGWLVGWLLVGLLIDWLIDRLMMQQLLPALRRDVSSGADPQDRAVPDTYTLRQYAAMMDFFFRHPNQAKFAKFE
jgi:hypothetical protein